MNDGVMGNTVPLRNKIKELETEVARLKKLLQDIQNPIRDDFDDWYFSYADDCC